MLLDAWRLALGTLTVVPVAAPSSVDRRRAGAAMVLAPVAAVPLGAAVVAVGVTGQLAGLPPLVTALLAVGALALGTRALHLDGLADTVDGLTASYDPERSLAVMKTGTSGPAGVAALVLVLGLQAGALASLAGGHGWRGAVLAGVAVCLSRGALAVLCARGVAAARPDGLGQGFSGTVPRGAAALVWAGGGGALALVAAWAGLPWWRGPAAAGLALAVVALLLARALRRLGGVTGDVLGAGTELALTALLVGLS